MDLCASELKFQAPLSRFKRGFVRYKALDEGFTVNFHVGQQLHTPSNLLVKARSRRPIVNEVKTHQELMMVHAHYLHGHFCGGVWCDVLFHLEAP
jgi:hypothetical protein